MTQSSAKGLLTDGVYREGRWSVSRVLFIDPDDTITFKGLEVSFVNSRGRKKGLWIEEETIRAVLDQDIPT
jgi:hypothetical protein